MSTVSNSLALTRHAPRGDAAAATGGVQPLDAAAAPAGSSELERTVTQLFAGYSQAVSRYVLGLVGCAGEAQDVTQEVFIKLYTALDAGQTIDHVRPWIFRVAHNLAMDHLRRRRPTDSLDDMPADSEAALVADESVDVEQRMLRREQVARVRVALSRLSAQERRCLELRAEGLRYREVAEVLGIRRPTVVTFVTRAIRKIGRALDE